MRQQTRGVRRGQGESAGERPLLTKSKGWREQTNSDCIWSATSAKNHRSAGAAKAMRMDIPR